MLKLNNLESEIVTIYRDHYLNVFRFLVCFTGNQNDAEDLTQEVFIRVLKNLPKFNRHYQFKTWIFSIAKHVAVDDYRKRRFSSIFKDGFFKQYQSTDHKPNEMVELNEMKQLIHAAISKLKPHYRAVVILRGINECSIKETAEILQCSESKVKVDFHRALKDLKKKLDINNEEVLVNAK